MFSYGASKLQTEQFFSVAVHTQYFEPQPENVDTREHSKENDRLDLQFHKYNLHARSYAWFTTHVQIVELPYPAH